MFRVVFALYRSLTVVCHLERHLCFAFCLAHQSDSKTPINKEISSFAGTFDFVIGQLSQSLGLEISPRTYLTTLNVREACFLVLRGVLFIHRCPKSTEHSEPKGNKLLRISCWKGDLFRSILGSFGFFCCISLGILQAESLRWDIPWLN